VGNAPKGLPFVVAAVFILVGASLSAAGAVIQGGAIAVLGAAAFVVLREAPLMPGWLIGPGAFFCIHHVSFYAFSPLVQLMLYGTTNHRVEGLVPAQWGAVLGLVTWALVYPVVFRLAAGAKQMGKRRTVLKIKTHSWRFYGLSVFVLGTIIMVLQARTASRVGPHQQVSLAKNAVVAVFQYTPLVALFFMAYGAIRYRGGNWSLLWVVGGATYVGWMFLDGGRGLVVIAACFSLCGFRYAGVSLNKIVPISTIAVVLLIPVFGVVRMYRDTYGGSVSSIADRMSGFREASTRYAQASGTVGDASRTFLERISDPTVDLVFIQTPSFVPYAGFNGLDKLAYVYIPQFVWPERPELLDGNHIANVEYGAADPTASGTSLSVVADGYRRFGWLGIPILYTLIASCCGIIASMAWKRRDRPEWVSTLLVLIMCLNGENTIASMVSTLYFLLWTFPKYLGFFWVISLFSDVIDKASTARRAVMRAGVVRGTLPAFR
jgi:hypothetical protein